MGAVVLDMVYKRVFGQPSKILAAFPKNSTAHAKERDKRHVGHNGRHEAVFLRPRCDELAKSVAPDIFVAVLY